MNIAVAASVAIQPDGIVGSPARLAVAQAMRQEEKAAMEGDRLEMRPPKFVAEGDHRESEKAARKVEPFEKLLADSFEFLAGERPDGQAADDFFGGSPDCQASLGVLRNLLDVVARQV